MNIEQLAKVLRALEAFDRSAQAHGWHADQGGQTTAFRAKKLYKAAKTRLTNLLKDVCVQDAGEPPRPIVQGLDDLLTVEERRALREEHRAQTSPSPPAAAVKELQLRGYSVLEWHYTDGWWVGYAHRDNPAICTISEVTGKALIEICKPHDYAEVLLP